MHNGQEKAFVSLPGGCHGSVKPYHHHLMEQAGEQRGAQWPKQQEATSGEEKVHASLVVVCQGRKVKASQVHGVALLMESKQGSDLLGFLVGEELEAASRCPSPWNAFLFRYLDGVEFEIQARFFEKHHDSLFY
jgi:hypothetical protein